MNNSHNDRDYRIDVIKGFCIFFVVFGHINTIANYSLQKVIFAFHVPVFVVISGYLAKDYNTKKDVPLLGEYLKRKTNGLLIPYYIYALFYSIYSLFSACIGMTDWNRFATMCIDRLLGLRATNIGPIWFLMALYTVTILDWIIQRYFKYGCIYILFGVLALVWMRFFPDFYLPFCIKNAVLLVPFYGLGRLIKRIKYTEQSYMLAISIFLVIIMIFTSYFNSTVFFYTCDVGNPILFLIESISGCIGVFGVLFFIAQKMGVFCRTIISIAGRESLDIMAIHLYIHMPICVIVSKFGIDFEGILSDSYVYTAGWSVLILFGSLFVGWGLRVWLQNYLRCRKRRM